MGRQGRACRRRSPARVCDEAPTSQQCTSPPAAAGSVPPSTTLFARDGSLPRGRPAGWDAGTAAAGVPADRPCSTRPLAAARSGAETRHYTSNSHFKLALLKLPSTKSRVIHSTVPAKLHLAAGLDPPDFLPVSASARRLPAGGREAPVPMPASSARGRCGGGGGSASGDGRQREWRRRRRQRQCQTGG